MVLSARNPQLARLRRLARDRGEREQTGAFVIEGPVLVAAALAAGIELEAVYAEVPGNAGEPTAINSDLARWLDAIGVPIVAVAPDGLRRAASTVTPQPVVAVARRPAGGLDAAIAAGLAAGLLLVLVDVADPGNAGTLMRTAEAAGAGAVIFCGPAAVDPYNPKCVRASAGSLFPITIASARQQEPAEVLAAIGNAGLRRVATTVRQGEPYDHVDLRQPVAVVMGNEAHGLPDTLFAEVDLQVTIPMVGQAESLNVAMAGTVLCFEVLRQRRAGARADAAAGDDVEEDAQEDAEAAEKARRG